MFYTLKVNGTGLLIHQVNLNNSRYRHDPEGSIHERTSLLYGSLQKINTMSSIITVADAYQVETPCVKKSSFLQSVFNCVNILIGVGILALPLGMKVCIYTYLNQ